MNVLEVEHSRFLENSMAISLLFVYFVHIACCSHFLILILLLVYLIQVQCMY